MLRLDHFSRPVRVAIRSLWVVAGLGLVGSTLPIVAYDAGHVEAAERERRTNGGVTQILARTLLARPHIQGRTLEPHEP